MKINIDDYKLSKPFIQKKVLEEKEKGTKLKETVSVLSASTFVPVIVVCFYAGEVLDWPQEILDKIKFLTSFYKYSMISNMPENYPKE